MKQKTGLLTLLAITLTVLLFVITGKRAYEGREKTAENPSANAGSGVSFPGESTHLSLKKMISAPVRNESTEMARLSPACSAFETALFALPLGDLEYPARAENLPNPEGCSASDPKVAKLLKFYQTKCQESFQKLPSSTLSKQKWNEKFGECKMATVLMRSSLAALARGEKPLSEITDMRELADRLVSSFGVLITGEMSLQGVSEIRATADRMAELDGRIFPAVKAGAMGRMLENVMQQEQAKDGARADWSDMEKRVAELERMNPNDPDLDSLRRITDTEGMNPDLVKKDSLSRLAKNPNDWREIQTLAWADFKQGRRDEAKATLARARALSPNNAELNANWAVVNRADSKPDDFKISMKVGVGFTELLQ